MQRVRHVSLLVVVLLLDLVIRTTDPPYGLLGVLDEPAHLATTAIALGCLQRVVGPLSRRTWLAALAAGVLIDFDHLPDVLGSDVLTDGTPRPYTHSLTTVLILVVLAVATRRGRVGPVVIGCALGVTAHLLRDVGTAPVALWWPVSTAGVSVPYAVYAGALGIAALAWPVRSTATPARA